MDPNENWRENAAIFTGRANLRLATDIVGSLGVSLGGIRVVNFSDGEISVKYLESIRGKNVVIIQSTQPPADLLMELLIMIDAAKRASAKQVIVVVPYFGYARQDRKDQPRVAITAKLVANLITKAGADRIISVDPHAPQLQGYFDIPFDFLYGSRFLIPEVRRIIEREYRGQPLAVVSPDTGSIKMARYWAKQLGVEVILIDKRHPTANQSEVLNVVGYPQGKVCLIIDDLADTLGTYCGASARLYELGATNVFGAVVHPLFSGDAFLKLAESGIRKLLVSDTLPIAQRIEDLPDALRNCVQAKIEIVSSASLIGTAITHALLNTSIAGLFDEECCR